MHRHIHRRFRWEECPVSLAVACIRGIASNQSLPPLNVEDRSLFLKAKAQIVQHMLLFVFMFPGLTLFLHLFEVLNFGFLLFLVGDSSLVNQKLKHFRREAIKRPSATRLGYQTW